jgi:hypothetical protein
MRSPAALLITAVQAEEKLDYNRDVRPILSDKCFLCHGPDAKNQKSDFRIDSFENATTDLGDYAGVVPGKLKESEVHWRLHTDDSTELMPPPEKKIPLTKEEIAILDRWIEEGAEYQEHWSFVPVREKVPVPEVNSDWTKGPIDQFIFARLQKEDLLPFPADKSRKVAAPRHLRSHRPSSNHCRRLMPFSPTLLPDAFEKVVDRLLDTDATGRAPRSRVARRSALLRHLRLPGRSRPHLSGSGVTGSFAPFGKTFPTTTSSPGSWQGDLLPNATRDQKLATAFNRLHGQKVEGGSVPEEFRIEYVSDRVHTYGTAFLGLTMECSRCHDHKYDPLTAEDYFSLSSYFDNIDEAGLYSYFTPSVPNSHAVATNGRPGEAGSQNWKRKSPTPSRELAKLAEEAKPAFEKWKQSSGGKALLPAPIASFDFEDNKSNKFTNAADKEKPATTNANNKLADGKFGKAVHLTGDDAVTLPVGNFTRDDAFSVSLWMQTPDKKERAVVFSRSKAWTDAASRGYEFLIEERKAQLRPHSLLSRQCDPGPIQSGIPHRQLAPGRRHL